MHPQWLLGTRRPPPGVTEFDGRILDVGAADQWLRAWIKDQAKYIALDYPATGRDLYHARPEVFADAASIPFLDDSFDGVCCFEVMEHVPRPSVVFFEIFRVLKPGGRAWISMPFLYPLHDAPFDFQRYTEFGLRRDVERAGFEVITLQRSGHAIRTAGLLACLAVSGGVYERRGVLRIVLLPLAAVIVLLINLIASLGCRIWPDWGRMAVGYEVEVRKP
ncbi:class I SAM-dependent methyltransferase [Dyella halodurans]|nr:class I SAM-dependent methyltransferase [Dyella halodurans]